MAYSGVLPGRTLEWFVPTQYKGRWLARGGRLLREINDDYLDDRPVPMSEAKPKPKEQVRRGVRKGA